MNRGLFLFALTLWAGPAEAQQQAVPLSLAEAEQRALDKNPTITAARLNTEAATYGVAMARAVYSPLFTASLAQRRLAAEEARRAAGLSTNVLVLQAQRDLATAQTNELRAALDHRTALVDFELVQESPA
jgi:outer membrane protein TolC